MDNPEITNAPKTSRTNGGGSRSGSSFKSQGKVLYCHTDGREEHYDSLHALAKAKDIKYNGRPTAIVAVEDPWTEEKDSDGKYIRFPYAHSVEQQEDKLVVKRIERAS